ncbi:MAG TPA: TetR family transcriptional regulator [Microthrixaceae bacterium]|nr:TetR family transcriptional regulator [Microthrixaceae bacterium]
MGRIAGVTPEETRERLLGAAARVFELKGFEGATVSLIASEAGVSSGAIYAHYGSKAELLVDALSAHREQVTASLFPAGSPVRATDILLTLANRLGDRDRPDSNLLAESLLGARRDPELAKVLADSLTDRQADMAEIIAEGQQAGQLSDDVSATAASRFALMLGLGAMLVRQLDMEPVDPSDWSTFTNRLLAAFTEE